MSSIKQVVQAAQNESLGQRLALLCPELLAGGWLACAGGSGRWSPAGGGFGDPGSSGCSCSGGCYGGRVGHEGRGDANRAHHQSGDRCRQTALGRSRRGQPGRAGQAQGRKSCSAGCRLHSLTAGTCWGMRRLGNRGAAACAAPLVSAGSRWYRSGRYRPRGRPRRAPLAGSSPLVTKAVVRPHRQGHPPVAAVTPSQSKMVSSGRPCDSCTAQCQHPTPQEGSGAQRVSPPRKGGRGPLIRLLRLLPSSRRAPLWE